LMILLQMFLLVEVRSFRKIKKAVEVPFCKTFFSFFEKF